MDAKKRLQDIITQFSENGLTELEFEIPDFKVRLVKEHPIFQSALPIQNAEGHAAVSSSENGGAIDVASQNSEAQQERKAAKSAYEEVRSTLVGTFYAYPSPTEESFVSVGKKVRKGETMCIIEAMKIMNELCAPYDLVVKSIKCENGAMVQYGEVLFEVEKC